MRFEPLDPPRRFRVGKEQSIEIRDCGRLRLEPDEMVTFVTGSGKEYDVGAKSWGFYATPSVNGRLKDQGFRTALVRNEAGRHYVMLVEAEHIEDFHEYLRSERAAVCEWLDERQ